MTWVTIPFVKPHLTVEDRGYQSALSNRYGSETMRELWSERNKRTAWRSVWANLLDLQPSVSEEISDLAHRLVPYVDVAQSLQEEKELKHDLLAELSVYRKQMNLCLPGSGDYLHRGSTSSDIEDNADAVRVCDSIESLGVQFDRLFCWFEQTIRAYRSSYCPGYTHLQEADWVTFGLRLSVYAYEFYRCSVDLAALPETYEGKGLRGAVGTAVSYRALLGLTPKQFERVEKRFCANLGICSPTITTQVSPRSQELKLAQVLTRMAAVAHKMGQDFRVLFSTPFSSLPVPFSGKQRGSSAMPQKRNPIEAEKLCGLCRVLASMERNFWDNAAMPFLERTLDDSSSRRLVFPEMMLLADEILTLSTGLLSGLRREEGFVPFVSDSETAIPYFGPLLVILQTRIGWPYDKAHNFLASQRESMKSWGSLWDVLERTFDEVDVRKIKEDLQPESRDGYAQMFIDAVLQAISS